MNIMITGLDKYTFIHNGFEVNFQADGFRHDVIVRISKNNKVMIRMLRDLVPFEIFEDSYGVPYITELTVMEQAIITFTKEFKEHFTRTDLD